MVFDLVIMFSHFHRNLPATLKLFKKELHKLFPVIYDTKHIIYQLRTQKGSDLFEGNCLHDLYTTFSSKKGSLAVLFSPTIDFLKRNGNQYASKDSVHEAGFDSYMTGYVFLRLAHVNALWGRKSSTMRALLAVEHLQSLHPYANCINLIRAQINHINIDGEDPVAQRPDLLLIQTRKPGVALNLTEVGHFMSKYGNIDVRLRNRHQALLAVGSYGCAREILKGFKDNSMYRVSRYNIFHQLPSLQPLAWITVMVAGGLGVCFAFKAASK